MTCSVDVVVSLFWKSTFPLILELSHQRVKVPRAILRGLHRFPKPARGIARGCAWHSQVLLPRDWDRGSGGSLLSLVITLGDGLASHKVDEVAHGVHQCKFAQRCIACNISPLITSPSPLYRESPARF